MGENEIHLIDDKGQPVCEKPRSKGILLTGDPSQATCASCASAGKKGK